MKLCNIPYKYIKKIVKLTVKINELMRTFIEEEKGERQKSVSLDVEEAFPSLRSRIQTFDSLKTKATRRILPDTPTDEPKLTIRRVSFENAAKPESVCLKKESDDSGCDENSEV